jgi:hypothetical protein
MRARPKPLWTSPLPADPPTRAQVVGHGREVLALVELGPAPARGAPGWRLRRSRPRWRWVGCGPAGTARPPGPWSATLARIFTTTRRLGSGGYGHLFPEELDHLADRLDRLHAQAGVHPACTDGAVAVLGQSKGLVVDQAPSVEVGRLELRPTSHNAASSSGCRPAYLRFLRTSRYRWCPLRSPGDRPGVYLDAGGLTPITP